MDLHEPKKILVPVDFSPRARAAVEYALVLARHFEADVHLLYAVKEPVAVGVDEPVVLWEFAHTRAGREMKRYLQEIEDVGVVVRGRLESGDTAEAILRVAAEERFDLIVMGTHGRTGLAHWVHGSIAEKVVRVAGCPVLTIRVPDRPRAGAADAPPIRAHHATTSSELADAASSSGEDVVALLHEGDWACACGDCDRFAHVCEQLAGALGSDASTKLHRAATLATTDLEQGRRLWVEVAAGVRRTVTQRRKPIERSFRSPLK
jgi:nucleotide-binding universal stress UspA family protein